MVHLIFPHLVSNTPFQGFPLSPVHWCIKCSACCCQVRFLIIINLKIIILQQSAIHTQNHQNKVRGAVSSLWGQQRSQTDQGESLCNWIFLPKYQNTCYEGVWCNEKVLINVKKNWFWHEQTFIDRVPATVPHWRPALLYCTFLWQFIRNWNAMSQRLV